MTRKLILHCVRRFIPLMVLATLLLILMPTSGVKADSVVTFPDINLDAVIRDSIGKPTGGILQSDLDGLTGLYAESLDIVDLTGLEHCTNLAELDLSYNQITNISPLSGLTSLEYLYLGGNQIIDISSLSGLTSLSLLSLWDNQITNISPLSGLASLQGVQLEGNQISDIAPLVNNPGIDAGDEVYIQDNPLSATSVDTYVPQLQARGVTVYYDDLSNQAPNQPSNVLPADGATGISLTPTGQSSAFSDPDAGDTHEASQWQITTTPGNYTSPVGDSGTDTSNLTSIATSPGTLSANTTYYWRVRYQDNHGAWSLWSTETSFTTIVLTPNPGAITVAYVYSSWGGDTMQDEMSELTTREPNKYEFTYYNEDSINDLWQSQNLIKYKVILIDEDTFYTDSSWSELGGPMYQSFRSHASDLESFVNGGGAIFTSGENDLGRAQTWDWLPPGMQVTSDDPEMTSNVHIVYDPGLYSYPNTIADSYLSQGHTHAYFTSWDSGYGTNPVTVRRDDNSEAIELFGVFGRGCIVVSHVEAEAGDGWEYLQNQMNFIVASTSYTMDMLSPQPGQTLGVGQEVSIEVSITDADGNPVSGATVTATSPSGAPIALTEIPAPLTMGKSAGALATKALASQGTGIYAGTYTILPTDPIGDWVVTIVASVGGEFPKQALSTNIVLDATPPTTSIVLDPPVPNSANGWYTSAVQVSLVAADEPGGCGVNYTEYSLNGGTSWLPYTAPFVVSTEGSFVVLARSADYAGNVEDPPKSATFKIDLHPPQVNITSPTSTSPTRTLPIPMTATFSEAVTGFVVGDITVGNGTAGNFVAVSTTVYTFDVTPSGQGAVTVNVAAAVAQDAALNGNTAAPQYSIIYDTMAPTIILTSTATSPTKTSPIPMTATFSEAVTGFVVGDITVGNGTAGNFVAVSTTVYTFDVTPSGQGAVTVNVAADVAQDSAANSNTAATQYSITYDSLPTITSFTTSSADEGYVVILTGTNFTGARAVKFADTDALSFTVDSDTQITAVVISGTSGKITVTTAGGTATSADDFTPPTSSAGSVWLIVGIIAGVVLIGAIAWWRMGLRRKAA